MTPGSSSRWMCARRRRVAAGASRMLLIIPTLLASVLRSCHLRPGRGTGWVAGRMYEGRSSAGVGHVVRRGRRGHVGGGDDPQSGRRARLLVGAAAHDALDVGALEDLVAQQSEGQGV